MEAEKEYKVIGVMSGTSLDGLDLAYCTFIKGKKWEYKILHAKTIAYQADWKNRLATIENKSALEYVKTHVEFGHYLGVAIKKFILEFDLHPDFISSHGHTIFHQPENCFTAQIGDGAAIAAINALPVICDFRTLDVALGGQGAPLVPIGDKLLFSESDYCLNLGGIANISYQHESDRIAFDICPVNMVLNHLAAGLKLEYDAEGKHAASGTVHAEMLVALNDLPFYKKKAPKSLGKEWVFEYFIPVIEKYSASTADTLATVCEHVALQISAVLQQDKHKKRMLLTGGGAFNTYLVERIRKLCITDVLVPDPITINYKEALIFAFLGVLRIRNEINSLKSVTGAERDSIGGTIYQG